MNIFETLSSGGAPVVICHHVFITLALTDGIAILVLHYKSQDVREIVTNGYEDSGP